MASRAMEDKATGGLPAVIIALAAQDGSAAHLYSNGEDLLRGRHATRNLADAIHHFGYLHGRHPGVVASALAKTPDAAKDWFRAAVDGFDQERSFLTKLVVAVGPTPSTPGQAECEAALAIRRRAPQAQQCTDVPRKVTPLPPACSLPGVLDHGGGAHERPARKAQTQTQINIFAIHKIAGIKPLHLPPRLARQHQARSIDPIRPHVRTAPHMATP